MQKAEKELSETVRSFMLSVPPHAGQKVAQQVFDRHNDRWKNYCTNMQKRYRWLSMDATAFEQRVLLINKQAERKLQPLKYYGKRLLPAVVAAIIIALLTDVVLPYFDVHQYRLFK